MVHIHTCRQNSHIHNRKLVLKNNQCPRSCYLACFTAPTPQSGPQLLLTSAALVEHHSWSSLFSDRPTPNLLPYKNYLKPPSSASVPFSGQTTPPTDSRENWRQQWELIAPLAVNSLVPSCCNCLGRIKVNVTGVGVGWILRF